MLPRVSLRLLGAIALGSLAACGRTLGTSFEDGGAATPLDAGQDGGASQPAPDAGGADAGPFVPASHPAFPQLVWGGGPVLSPP